ncbi:uncharacterized protein [Periplaneta americana]|uniref:uncharacterized protein n=1 Tax=Periplaneta americana TaxID=6978 RepID=UPI0037E95F24
MKRGSMELKILLSVWLILGLQLCSLGRTSDGNKFVEEESDCVYAPPSRRIMGVFNGMDNDLEGHFLFQTTLGKISDIIINEEWLNGTGSIAVKGIGEDHVFIIFNVPLGVSLTVDVLLFTDGDSEKVDEEMCENFLDLSRNALKHMKKNSDNIGMQLMTLSFYETFSEALLEIYMFGSNYGAIDCFGSTFWYNEVGTMIIDGGIGDDVVSMYLLVPARGRAANMYSCVFFSNDKYSSRKRHSYQKEFQVQIEAVFDETIFIYETYGSIYPEGETFHVKETVIGVIAYYYQELTLKNGIGRVSEYGGFFSNYTVYQIDKSLDCYGSYQNIYLVMSEQELVNMIIYLLMEDDD